jgi:hypothetical protein
VRVLPRVWYIVLTSPLNLTRLFILRLGIGKGIGRGLEGALGEGLGGDIHSEEYPQNCGWKMGRSPACLIKGSQAATKRRRRRLLALFLA